MKKQTRSVGDYLRSDPLLRQLLSQQEQQRQLCDQVHELLPEQLRPHCLATVLVRDRLRIYADSPAWASRLRYLTRDLGAALRGAGIKVGGIHVRVLVAGRTPRRRPHAPRNLSPESARLIRQLSDEISDPMLSAALRRLSRHTG
ncbi:MAG: hypothetical protein B0D84_01415 [Candidatus Sedimenticola endophacoides]|uniref:DUF721 domain-containing protein n=1 Tax=Candidatus Sedimenticola endophacoides TaxID=2548426 RepID=A0A657PPW3_9GAMM|nr:MAG: hypothetical protein B0D84_01415 [Candidatus Sedimenticola endophacoides]